MTDADTADEPIAEEPIAEASADRPAGADDERDGGGPAPRSSQRFDRLDKLPIKMLNDRILVRIGGNEGERRSSGGILIPATAAVGKRLMWARAVAIGPNVRTIHVGDQVLFDPEDHPEVELQGQAYVLLRERDVHALAAARVQDGAPGLYL